MLFQLCAADKVNVEDLSCDSIRVVVVLERERNLICVIVIEQVLLYYNLSWCDTIDNLFS